MEKAGDREYKSSVFTMLLKEKANALDVFNALNGTDHKNEEDLEIRMLESAVYLSFRNDASFIIADTLNLYEHQSTYNPNMPLRDLIYAANLFADIVKDENLFGKKLVQLPEPRFVTFYNGTEQRPPIEILRLSDAYMVKTDQPQLELCCTVINMNPGCNVGFMEKCRVLSEYTVFVEKVRLYQKTMSLEDALERAIDECIQEHVLEDFFKRQKAEVMSMSVLEFNLEKQLMFAREEGKQAGILEGKQAGLSEGKQTGSDLKLISQICRKLKKDKTPECIAEELEEELELVEKICKTAKEFAPEYDEMKIYEALHSCVA